MKQGYTIQELMKMATETVKQMSPEEKARLREQLRAGLKKPSKTRGNLWIN